MRSGRRNSPTGKQTTTGTHRRLSGVRPGKEGLGCPSYERRPDFRLTNHLGRPKPPDGENPSEGRGTPSPSSPLRTYSSSSTLMVRPLRPGLKSTTPAREAKIV